MLPVHIMRANMYLWRDAWSWNVGQSTHGKPMGQKGHATHVSDAMDARSAVACCRRRGRTCCAHVKAPGTGVSKQAAAGDAGDAGTTGEVVLMLCVDTVAAGAVGVVLATAVVTGLAVTTGAGELLVGVVGTSSCRQGRGHLSQADADRCTSGRWRPRAGRGQQDAVPGARRVCRVCQHVHPDTDCNPGAASQQTRTRLVAGRTAVAVGSAMLNWMPAGTSPTWPEAVMMLYADTCTHARGRQRTPTFWQVWRRKQAAAAAAAAAALEHVALQLACLQSAT